MVLYQVTMMAPRGASPLRYNDATVRNLAAEVLRGSTAPGLIHFRTVPVCRGNMRFPQLSDDGVTRRQMVDRASVPINSSTFGRIAACLPAAPDRSRSLLEIRVRIPWPGVRYCDSWHPAGLAALGDEIFESAEGFQDGMNNRTKLNAWRIERSSAHASASG